ncbi:TPA: hypothetical protein ACNTW9_004919, partial [Klebsiella pneumoniae]
RLSKTLSSRGLMSCQPAIIAQNFCFSFPVVRNLQAMLTFRRIDAYNARRLYSMRLAEGEKDDGEYSGNHH